MDWRFVPSRQCCKLVMTEQDKSKLQTMVTHGVPAISDFDDAELITGIHRDGLIHLEKVKHLKALGRPTPGCQRYFSTHYLLTLRTDEEWLDKAAELIRKHFKGKNLACKSSASRNRGGNRP